MIMTVSVIIPIYNVEFFLRQCIDSVLTQTFHAFEVILVDDGSTDGSGMICDEYKSKDSRIKVVHKANGGVASARKAGLEISCGKYIAYIDSDDWVEQNHLQVMVEFAEEQNADMVICDFYKNRGNHIEYVKNEPSAFDTPSIMIDMLRGHIHAGVVLKLFRKSLFNRFLTFPLYNYYEDMFISISALHYAQKVSYLNRATYYYRYNEFSLTHHQDAEKRIQLYQEFVLNMKALDQQFQLSKDKEIKDALYYCINYNKRGLVKKYFNHPKLVCPLLRYFQNSFTIHDIKGLGDIFYFFASRYGWLYPYKLREKYHLGHA